MNSVNFDQIDKALSNAKGLDIDVKLLHQATEMHKKLGQELKITEFLKTRHHHDNYKDIRNDISKINNMLTEAEDQSIDIDKDLVAKVNQYCSRLISERNLRKNRDLLADTISKCDHSQVDKLQDLIDIANKNQVEDEYIKNASYLKDQMAGNIKARETLQMLQAYPERIYPEVEVDPKKKDKKAPPKKRKKKEPPFPYPEWALEIDQTQEKIREMERLKDDKKNLMLDEDFIIKVNEQLERFKKEINFRKQMEEEARLEAELKAKNKKKKK